MHARGRVRASVWRALTVVVEVDAGHSSAVRPSDDGGSGGSDEAVAGSLSVTNGATLNIGDPFIGTLTVSGSVDNADVRAHDRPCW